MMRKLRQDKKKQHSIRQMSKRMLSLVLAASLAFPAANFAAVGTLAGTSVEAALKPSATETIDGVTYSTYSFDVAENIVTQEGKSASDLYGGKTMTIGRGRCLYLQYDITGLEELLANGSVVTEAKIAMTRSGSAGNQSNVHFIKDNSWIENASHIDYASGNAPAYEKFVLGSTSTVGISGEFTIDVTDVFYRYESDVESALSFMVTGSKTDGTDPTVTDENGLDVYTKYNGSEVPRIDITIAKISKETAEKQVALTRAKLAAGVLTNQLGGKEMVKDFSLIRDMSLYLGDASTTVAWTCDSPYVQISEDGNKALVTRPGVEDEDDEVTLYAHISYNGQTYTKKIKVMVLKESSEVRVQPSQQWFIQNGATADLNGPEYMENKGIDGKTTAIGRGRETLMSIPLEEIDENATKVELYYWNTNGNNTTTIDTNVYTFDSTVDVSSLSYNAVHALDLTSVGTFTLVKKAEQGVIDLTKAVLDAKKAGDTNINLLFDGSWSTTTTIAQIAGITYDLDETKRPYLTFSIEEIESRLPEAVEIVKSLDGTIHTEDFLFPDVSSISGASVEWSVDANDYLDINADGSEAYVYRPAKDAAGDAEVTLHALVKWGDESQEVDVTVIIPKERTISPYLRPSLERMLNRVELLLQLAEEDTVYSAEVLSKDFNEYLLKTEVPVYENAGTAYGEQVVRKTEATVPRIDLTVDDADRQLGQLSVVAYQELKTAYDTAKDVYDNGTETQYSPEIQNLIRKGKAFVGSGKTDDSLYTNKVSDADLWKLPAVASDDSSTSKNARRYEKVTILPGDELAYSTYRAFEESLVWESYALLEVEPELYPQSAKDALQQKIDDAEKALNGTYYLMMAKSRQFFQSRPDEYIQRTTLYQSKVWNFESFEYGLQRSMEWYRKQSMAASVSYTVNAGLEEGTLNFEGLLVRQSNGTIERKTNSTWIVGSSASGQSYINPHNRVSVIQYNLDEIQKIAPIYSAELSATNAKSSYTLVQAQLLDNRASLVDYTLDDSYNDYFFKFTPRAQNVTVTVPMLDQVLQNVYDGNDAVTILLDTGETEERGVTAAQDIYSSTAAVDDDKKGHLKVILEQINTVKMKDTIEEYIEEKSENIADLKADGLVYDSKKGITKDTLPGSYPSNLVNKVTDKIAELQDALNNEKDPYKIIEVWTDLDDANLEMRDAIVLSMDVNEKNNIFFSEQEVEELGERISNDPELAATYQGVKNIADRQDVEELTQLRYDKLDNGEGLNSNYKLWYGASNCNFTVPANASSVYFTATLPAKYNEAEGLGHIWFDNIVITANSGAKAEVPNNIFRYGSATKPSYWNGYVYDAQTNEVIGDIDKGISNLPSGTLSDYVKFQKGDQNYASSGSNSVYLCNPTSDVYTQWRSDNFELAADSYTMSYQIKQEGKFSGGNGLIVQVHYLDATGKEIGASNEYSTNVVGNISGYTSGNMTYQCATLCYIVTGDEKYAKVAKAGLYIYLEEALQGMHSWEDYYHHGRPPYGDVFGAVQNGRSAATIGTMYAVMKNVRLSDGSPLFSVGEKRQLLVSINDFIGDLMDIRDRTVIPVTEIAEGISNWETDMAMGSSLLGMGFAHDDGSMYTDEEVIEAGYVTADGKADRAAMQKDIELPYAIRYIDNTTQTIKGTLVSEIRDDGAWPESINYHGAMLEKLASYSMGSRYCIGVDLFTYTRDYEDPEEQERYGVLSTLAKMLKYYTQVQAPRYTNGNASQPAFGDGKFDSGTNFKYCGAYWKEMYDKWDPNDPSTEQYHELARDMYGVWTRAGRPRPQQANEENMMQFFFVHSEWPKEDQAFLDKFSENQKSNDFMKYFGTYIFRNNFDVIDKRTNQYKESYVAFMAQDKATGHNHYDQGSFIMYADSIPLVIDPGMDNYWSAAKTVLLSTDSHSTVQLKKSANAYDNVQKYVNDREFYASDKMDMARIVGTCQGSTGQFQRTYAFVKDGFEAHVIWDQISGTSFGSRINFVLATKEVLPKSFTGNKITAESFNGESLDIFVLEGDTSTYTGSEQLKASGDLSKRAGESNPIVDVLRLENEGNDNYLTVLFPRNSAGTRGTLTTEEITVSGKNKIHGYKLIHNNGEHTVYVVTNDRQSAQTVTLPADVRSMMDEQGTEYAANEPIQIAANTMMLFTSNMKDEADEVANGPVISAPSTPPTAPNGAQNMGGGVAVTDENEYLTGNNDKLDMSVPGVTNAPKAEMTVDGDKVTITAENGQTVYYSVDGGKTYQQYTGSFTLPAGDNKICYFTANSTTGLKTKAIVSAVSVDAPAVAKSVITVKGLKQKLKLKNSTGAVVTYKVADKKIATVSKKGNITPKRIGTTKVTMTVKVNGAKYKLKTKIKVVKVKVSSKLTLNADKKKAITLKCAKLPSEITYRSEDKSIATVSKLGKVTGKKAGTTTIYTTVVVDEKTYELKTKVTVK